MRTLVHSQARAAFWGDNASIGEPEILPVGNGQVAVLVKNLWIGRSPFGSQSLQHMSLYLVESSNDGRSWYPAAEAFQGSPNGQRTAFMVSDDRVIISWSQYIKRPDTYLDSDVMYRTKIFGHF